MKPNDRSIFLILLACAFLAASGPAHAQKLEKKEMPLKIIAAFEKSYPKAIATSWSREERSGQAVYEIESTDGKIRRTIKYSADGAVLEIEESISSPALPDSVKKGLRKEYPRSTVRSAQKLTRGAIVEYEMIIKSGKQTLEVLYDNNGNLLKADMVR